MVACRLQEVNKQWNESPFIADNVNQLSPEARDLLDRIFVLDPTKRITIPDIMHHPWCRTTTCHRSITQSIPVINCFCKLMCSCISSS